MGERGRLLIWARGGARDTGTLSRDLQAELLKRWLTPSLERYSLGTENN